MTENEPSLVDSGEFTVRRTITIAASIEKVWAAITEATHVARWFGRSAVLDTVTVGSVGIFSFDGHGDFPVRIEECDPPRTIASRWGDGDPHAVDPLDPDRSTVFRFVLDVVDGGTQFRVVESGFWACLIRPRAWRATAGAGTRSWMSWSPIWMGDRDHKHPCSGARRSRR